MALGRLQEREDAVMDLGWRNGSTLLQEAFATDPLEGYGEWRDTLSMTVRPVVTPDVFLDVVYGHEVVVSPEVEAAPRTTISVRRYAVQHLTLWVTLVALAMVWSILTGIAFAQSGYWLNAATGVFGCLGFVATAVSLAVAGRSRRV